jgi:hypothetical protein
MPKENKVLRMFSLLEDRFEVKVGSSGHPEQGERTLRITLTDHGMRFSFDSNNDDYRAFIVNTAKEELGVAFSSANIRDLNLQLETIARVIEEPPKPGKGCGCGCPVDDHIDDE